jgi:aspartyl-tRNA(Asn)/glutamyl-tRNA(Gln) amidotransferase subunit A
MTASDHLTIHEAGAQLRSGHLTSAELTHTLLERSRLFNETLGAWVEITAEAAMEQATRADADFSSGVDRGPLQGIPLAVKDIVAMKGAPTTANSRVLDPDWGSDTDAPVVARLREAGAVLLGKSTTMEFAMGEPDPSMPFRVPRNPWDITKSPSGSSSGTGIAVAAGLALGGVGTDTGGSVRGPASANGHTGLKVTFGRVPKSSVVPLACSLDTVGPMARSAHDCALLLESMAGYDPSDPDCATVSVEAYSAALDGQVEGLRIGLPIPYFFDHADLDPQVLAGVLACVDVLVDRGAISVNTEVPHAHTAMGANRVIMMSEAYSYHRNNLVARWSDYGRYTRTAIARGATFSAGDLAQAYRFRRFFASEVAEVLRCHDVLITPTTPTTASDAESEPNAWLQGPSFLGQWNLVGLPAVAVPAGFAASGLPISLQIIGRPFAESTILKLADALQRVTSHHLAVPPVDHLEVITA